MTGYWSYKGSTRRKDKNSFHTRVAMGIKHIRKNGITRKALEDAAIKYDIRPSYLLKVGGWDKLTDKGRSR